MFFDLSSNKFQGSIFIISNVVFVTTYIKVFFCLKCVDMGAGPQKKQRNKDFCKIGDILMYTDIMKQQN